MKNEKYYVMTINELFAEAARLKLQLAAIETVLNEICKSKEAA